MKKKPNYESTYIQEYDSNNSKKTISGYFLQKSHKLLEDFLPNNKSYKAHLNLLFGTGLPYGPPGRPDQKALLRIPPYRRVDLGFSKVLIGDQRLSTLPGFLKHLKNTWISLEVFNLLDINNTISHIWIRDISNRQYSIPNYLTGRRINLKLQVRF